jgi:hypothetical protein
MVDERLLFKNEGYTYERDYELPGELVANCNEAFK